MMRVDAGSVASSGDPELPPTLRKKAGVAAARARRYLLGRQSPNGGFCFYRWQGIEEPTLSDTWHAVAALTLLGAEVPRRDHVAAFLRGFDVAGFDNLYHRTLALDRMGEPAPAPVLRRRIAGLDATVALKDNRLSPTIRLERASRTVHVQRTCGVSLAREEIAERVEALRHAGGGWGDKPNLRDTRRALSLLAACGQCAFREETRRFVDAMQASSFGFTATSDSSYARLDTVHAGVHACVLLGLPLRHGADALDFVLACQSSEGGFAHTPDALPDIALTHRALSVLSMLGLPGTPIPAAGAEG